MGKSKEQIIVEITNHLASRGIQNWNEVYVGIAKDPKDRLFNGHKVKEKGGIWIYRLANSSDCAREVEKYLLDKGAAGGPGGGDDDTIYVYAYKKESYTIDS